MDFRSIFESVHEHYDDNNYASKDSTYQAANADFYKRQICSTFGYNRERSYYASLYDVE